jgi:hypothetical protein
MSEISYWNLASETQKGIILEDLEVNGSNIIKYLGASRLCSKPPITLIANSVSFEPSPSDGVNEYTASIICEARKNYIPCRKCVLNNKKTYINSRRPFS